MIEDTILRFSHTLSSEEGWVSVYQIEKQGQSAGKIVLKGNSIYVVIDGQEAKAEKFTNSEGIKGVKIEI